MIVCSLRSAACQQILANCRFSAGFREMVLDVSSLDTLIASRLESAHSRVHESARCLAFRSQTTMRSCPVPRSLWGGRTECADASDASNPSETGISMARPIRPDQPDQPRSNFPYQTCPAALLLAITSSSRNNERRHYARLINRTIRYALPKPYPACNAPDKTACVPLPCGH